MEGVGALGLGLLRQTLSVVMVPTLQTPAGIENQRGHLALGLSKVCFGLGEEPDPRCH